VTDEYVVASGRLKWASGTRLGVDDLEGCNIAALVAAGHLVPAPKKSKPVEQSEED